MEENLLNSVKKISSAGGELPFSVYTSVREQKLLNVPITKPLLIVVLSGHKELGKNHEIVCNSNQFIFLSDSPAINMRNIPNEKAYFALLIEFDYEDFLGIPINSASKPDYIIGEISLEIEQCLQQFIESVAWAPQTLWLLRKKEILMLLYQQGYKEVISMMDKPKVSHQLHDLFIKECFHEINTETLCSRLAVSESTLRRKLKSEGTSVIEIKDRARLGLGLQLLQTTSEPINLIAEKCGYASPSRFTQRFKGHFGLTPTELRKTQMED